MFYLLTRDLKTVSKKVNLEDPRVVSFEPAAPEENKHRYVLKILREITLLVLFVAASSSQSQSIKLNKIIEKEELEHLWPYRANTNILFNGEVGVILQRESILFYDREKEAVVTIKTILPNKYFSMNPISYVKRDNGFVCIFLNTGIGRY